jgi:hypothetical protein
MFLNHIIEFINLIISFYHFIDFAIKYYNKKINSPLLISPPLTYDY